MSSDPTTSVRAAADVGAPKTIEAVVTMLETAKHWWDALAQPPAPNRVVPAGLEKVPRVVLPTDPAYELAAYQYATSSSGQYGGMRPAAIVYAAPENGDAEVTATLESALSRGVAVALRSGGHQYSGSSSTGGANIQLDLSRAYPEFDTATNDLMPTTPGFDADPSTGVVKVGVSLALADMNDALCKKGLFVPHGQCSHVHVGGHAQTGGWGQLARSHGLFADHIVAFRIITLDKAAGGKAIAPPRIVRRGSTDPDDAALFFGVLGGSPGNFGVLTHIYLRPLRDADFPCSRGMKLVTPFHKGVLERLLQTLAELSDDDATPGKLDVCITVMSCSNHTAFDHDYNANADRLNKAFGSEVFSRDNILPVANLMDSILVYVQWVSATDDKAECDAYFNRLIQASGVEDLCKVKFFGPLLAPMFMQPPGGDGTAFVPVSQLMKSWVFTGVREHMYPAIKRTYATSMNNFSTNGFAKTVSERMGSVMMGSQWSGRVFVSSQIQFYGGDKAAFKTKANAQTAYSWRDTTRMGVTLDIFYRPDDPGAVQHALDWADANDADFQGRTVPPTFATADHRWSWASYTVHHHGEANDMEATDPRTGQAMHAKYLEDAHLPPGVTSKYDYLVATKRAVDPVNLFTPNAFCVGGGPSFAAEEEIKHDVPAGLNADALREYHPDTASKHPLLKMAHTAAARTTVATAAIDAAMVPASRFLSDAEWHVRGNK